MLSWRRFCPTEHMWNEALIKEEYTPIDAKYILPFQVWEDRQSDGLVFHHECKGLFTVHSAYHLLKHLGAEGDTSYGEQGPDLQGWRFIWDSSIPRKVHIFA
ncbi:hypothetical protein Salat_2506000 [Sesamum alatum]|uniref:Uncharacterized protein n=1 Tax=Sesamum alatum TaxID=300844 RepID=A0AAE1XRM9_9LAMI|nr:hypothetical protein Salat_2506000 [Sesamum alatum]